MSISYHKKMQKIPIKTDSLINRRKFIKGVASLSTLSISGCATTTPDLPEPKVVKPVIEPTELVYVNLYGPVYDEKFPIPAVNLKKVDKRFYRQQVDYQTIEAPGTVIVDTHDFYLYHVEENGKAMRYGVGLGRAGFEWSGRARIGWKQEWPKWTPPDEMIERQPELEKYSAKNGGMPPGIDNPLGARALYIFQGKVDTLYRLHGSPEYWSIGKAVSSGCVRLMNQDIINLYSRVKTHSEILVI